MTRYTCCQLRELSEMWLSLLTFSFFGMLSIVFTQVQFHQLYYLIRGRNREMQKAEKTSNLSITRQFGTVQWGSVFENIDMTARNGLKENVIGNWVDEVIWISERPKGPRLSIERKILSIKGTWMKISSRNQTFFFHQVFCLNKMKTSFHFEKQFF